MENVLFFDQNDFTFSNLFLTWIWIIFLLRLCFLTYYAQNPKINGSASQSIIPISCSTLGKKEKKKKKLLDCPPPPDR